ncbi:MAG: hypothetical protein IJD96_00680 [Lachnospiraceae bacterium]|nr:hypothetical protein [Lachnospiraceae bacterium]
MNIHLLGDSIVKSYGDDEWNFIGGWGDHFKAFLAQKMYRKDLVLRYRGFNRETMYFCSSDIMMMTRRMLLHV